MKISVAFVIAILSVFISIASGCATTQTAMPSTTSSPTPAQQVTGVWEGTWVGRSRGAINLYLKQDGKKVTGTYELFGGGRPIRNEPISGNLEGETLTLEIPAVAYGYIRAILQNGKMSGTYSGFAGSVLNFTAIKK